MAERQRPSEERSSDRSVTGEPQQTPVGTPQHQGKGAPQQTTHEERSSTAEMTAEMKEKAESKARELGHEAEERAERWTSSVGRQAESLARALRVASDSLWTEGEERMATVVVQAADQVDRMSGYLEDENPSEMLDDLADVGRQNPAAFLGSAFAMGLAAGRFLRASSPNGPEGSDRRTREERMSGAGVGATAGAYTAPSGASTYPGTNPTPTAGEGPGEGSREGRTGTQRRS